MSSSVAARPRAGSARNRNGLTHVVLIIASVLMIFPFVWQILMSLATNAQVTSVPPTVWPGELHFENFAHVFDQLPFLNQLWVSVAVTVIRTVGQLLLCSMAGYAFARMEFPFRRTIFALVLAIGIAGLQQLGNSFFAEPIFQGTALIVSVGLAGYAARRRKR